MTYSEQPNVESLHASGGYSGYSASLYGDWTFVSPVVIPNLSGTNTGDQSLSGYQTVSGMTGYFNKTDDDTADIVENPDYRFVSVTNQTKLSNLSGTNTGDQDLTTLLDIATYDPGTIAEQVVGLTATQTVTNKTLTSSTIRLIGYTVSTLPSGTQGDTAFCTDLLLPTFFAIAVGSGAVIGPVFHNGTDWICT